MHIAPSMLATAALLLSARATAEVLFFEDFDSGALDRSHWNVESPEFWVNNEQQIYIDSPRTIDFLPAGEVEGADNGVLALRPLYSQGVTNDSGRVTDFVSGRIDSKDKFDFTHGRAEARIRMPEGVGLWPAFWLLGNDRWPDTGEIDIMEYVGDPSWAACAVHGPGYSGDTPLIERYHFPEGQDVTGWHVYAVEWSDEAMHFMVDDQVYYTVTKADVERYGEWRFDNDKYLILNFAVGGAYPHGVFGIEEPYFGLPQETVDLIKTGEVAMLVDWVRVSSLD